MRTKTNAVRVAGCGMRDGRMVRMVGCPTRSDLHFQFHVCTCYSIPHLYTCIIVLTCQFLKTQSFTLHECLPLSFLIAPYQKVGTTQRLEGQYSTEKNLYFCGVLLTWSIFDVLFVLTSWKSNGELLALPRTLGLDQSPSQP